ncbi:DUF4326 domain-containing protein [Streptomyces sp. B21-108]|uniref:DUF4326 domain-containing protein n=1 Tax=Streptomyces sp. B21-108 TaxID=3039419 RepID=UPI002FF1688C
MTTPHRIQRRRTKGWRAEDHTTSPLGAVYVGRPTRFGNPFRVAYDPDTKGWHVAAANGFSVGTFPTDAEARRYATDAFRVWLNQPERESLRALFRSLLHGRDLACWCPLPEPGRPDHCHAAVLLELSNGAEEPAR